MLINFEHEGVEVRVVGTEDDTRWVADDVRRVLNLSENTSTLLKNMPPRYKDANFISTPGGPQEMLVLKEPGLYLWIFRSNRPEAIRFRERVFEEVLPSIRKYGCYPPPMDPVQREVVEFRTQQEFERSVLAVLEPAMKRIDRLHELFRQQSEQIQSVLLPLAEMLPRLEQTLAERRDKIKTDVKRRHQDFIAKRRNGFCPCCQRVQILDNNTRIPYASEFDHFWLRSRCNVDEVWLVCKSCNNKLRNKRHGQFWRSKAMTFLGYVEDMQAFESTQVLLPFMVEDNTDIRT